MKLISLNCWFGKIYEPLVAFIKKHAQDTDIFCFQEMVFGGPDEAFHEIHKVRGQLFRNIAQALPDHTGLSAPSPRKSTLGTGENVYTLKNGAKIGQAVFVKKSISILDQGSFLVYSRESDPFENASTGHITGNFQYLQIGAKGKQFIIGNIHGLWQQAKDDTPARLEQSKRILEFFEKKETPAIVMGDFNLRPETQSIAMLSATMDNLIAEYDVKTTRNHYYTDMEKWKDYIADYAFVSPDVVVKDFQVLPDEVSDHSPLLLEFE